MSHLSSLRFTYAARLAILIFIAIACQTSPETPSPTTSAASPSSSAAPTQPARATPPRTRSGPTPTSTPLPGLFVPEQTYRGPLTLVEADLPIGDCEQASPFDLPADGLIQVAFVPTQVCLNEEIGLLEIGDRLVVVQGGGYPAAFTLTDVTDPAQPEFIGAWGWKQLTYTADVKTFRQGERWYLVLGLEASGDELSGAAPCGIAIVEVSDPRAPKLIGNTHGQALTPHPPLPKALRPFSSTRAGFAQGARSRRGGAIHLHPYPDRLYLRPIPSSSDPGDSACPYAPHAGARLVPTSPARTAARTSSAA